MQDMTPSPASSLGRHSVAFRLWASVIAVIVALIAVITFAAVRSSKVQEQTTTVAAAMDAKVDAAKRWAGLTTTNVVRVQASAASTDPAVDALFKEVIPATIGEISKVQKAIEAMDLSDKDKALMDKVAAERKIVLESLAKIRSVKATDPAAAAQELSARFNPAVDVYLKSLNDFAEEQVRAKAEILAELAEQRKSTVRIAGVLIALVVIGLIAGAFWLVRSIQQPLAQAMKAADQIAGGDLTTSVHVSRRDEFGLLLGSMERMVAQLRSVVGEVRQGIESVSTASSEIATGNHDLSARTEQTASSLQQTASSMEQLTATVGHSADTARQANQLAGSAAEAAVRGGQVVEQVVSNMAQITESSRKIGDIIGTIDGIAFQTNILALNAAVEAARAGEQGRGFAVVASEVRSLAQRSAEAAKEIKTLIGASVERVESGAQLVEQTGTAMQDIVTSVKRVTDLIGEIASAATEQRDGIAQVNVAVTNLDHMTQQNAALVEESAAAAQSLREQSARLAEVVSVFKVDQKFQAPAATGAPKPVTRSTSRPSPVAAKKPTATKPKPAARSAPSPAPAPKASPAPTTDEWESF
ncbi:methyl-accepting chemotaxis protein [Paucibacter sp. PLA-PC-4]|uniref:methyl-accepting chemotaxis protein n=1 Tax=Paucibacter sp. PLA-PC-4 TaxID=2993655 RepID=UPI00224895A8|nr:methyl-accepting chemotaxis protein [Paucibacter sp. PLA-PC-4]MCX2862185.1 methyl-accepting chemotaxis protein [Paucibacter sp. PLA-PC-4]